MPTGLLQTKLFSPPARPNLVTRATLLEKLDHARRMGVPFILVSAPAGFGKTTLISDWTRSSGLPCAWFTLDVGDNDLLRFWRYLDAALETIDTRIGESLRPALYAPQTPAIQQIITGLVNDVIACEVEFILVLDDYHLIEQTEIHASLNFLLDNLPPQMCLVITTRSDPPLNLARRRGRGQLLDIRAGDLRFTQEEIVSFLNQTMQLGLSGDDIAALGQRTEGWIAGLQMAALSMQDETDPHAFVTAFSGDDHHIADYLVEEVLQRQLVEVQRFLLQTSILDRLSAPLCDALTGRQDSRAMLNTLERANLFLLPLDTHREWFRYHHLFAELLYQRLRETQAADQIADLHRTAATWYEAQGDIPSAIHYAHAIPDEAYILQLLEKNAGKFFATGDLPRLFELAGLLPPELRKKSPRLAVSVAWAGLATNHHGEIPAWLSAIESYYGMPAESALKDNALDVSQRAAFLEVLVIRLQLPSSLTIAEQGRRILAVREELEALPPERICLLNPVGNLKPVIAFNLGLHAESTGDLPLAAQTFAETLTLARQTQNNNLFHLAAGHLANLRFLQGQLHAAQKAHEGALSEAGNIGQTVSPFVAISHAGLGLIHYEWSDLAAAESHFNEGLVHARLWNQWESLIPLALGRARLKVREGQIPEALKILDEWQSPPIPGTDLPLRAYAALLRGPDSAAAWLEANLTESMLQPDPANETALLIISHLMEAAGRRNEALDLLQNIATFAKNGRRIHTLIQAQVALSAIGERPEALVEALQLAQPEGYISTFIDEGEQMQNLLKHVLAHAHLEPHLATYTGKLLLAFGPAPRKPEQVKGLVEALSERELEVLRYIADGLSNPEIARRLYLSPNTLKAHTQNIFMKMDVHNRLQAVNRAKELGLIE
jgi:LuxR family maltose regulon positive regulatory protein